MEMQRHIIALGAIGVAVSLLVQDRVLAQSSQNGDLAQQIFETMVKVGGNRPNQRPVHTKGIVCKGTFTPSKDAASLSKANHFHPGAIIPVTVRFSEGSSDPVIPDNSPNAGPHGMAIRFALPDAGETDIVAISHNGFVVGTGEEFLALEKAMVATDASKPHPWPIENFLAVHPRAMNFVQENRSIPASFATQTFFSNDTFIFVNKDGVKQPARYKIFPFAGTFHLSEAEAKTKAPDFLFDDLQAWLEKDPAKFRLVAQLPNDGDSTSDPSLVWPDDRRTVELGVISVNSVATDSKAAEKTIAFDPTNLTDGIELSDDPLPALRSTVYALSAKYRHAYD